MGGSADLENIVAQVSSARKSQAILPGLIRRIAERELAAGGPTRDVVKRVKRQLHQSGGAYFPAAPKYDRWLDALEHAPEDERLAVLQSLFGRHSSMAERAGDLESYYAGLFAGIEDTESVLDLACGFNPLGLAWMPIRPARYVASDIYRDMLDFVEQASALCGHPVQTFAHDLVGPAPAAEADTVLLLKTLPCLNQIDPGSDLRLLQALTARHIVVTYPTRSLGGCNKGMAANYSEDFHRLAERLEREVVPLKVPFELGFRLTR